LTTESERKVCGNCVYKTAVACVALTFKCLCPSNTHYIPPRQKKTRKVSYKEQKLQNLSAATSYVIGFMLAIGDNEMKDE
jgi:hypothetical protein